MTSFAVYDRHCREVATWGGPGLATSPSMRYVATFSSYGTPSGSLVPVVIYDLKDGKEVARREDKTVVFAVRWQEKQVILRYPGPGSSRREVRLSLPGPP